jgi:hypothetical protein
LDFSLGVTFGINNKKTSLLFSNNKKLGKLFSFIGNGGVVAEAYTARDLSCYSQCFRAAALM